MPTAGRRPARHEMRIASDQRRSVVISRRICAAETQRARKNVQHHGGQKRQARYEIPDTSCGPLRDQRSLPQVESRRRRLSVIMVQVCAARATKARKNVQHPGGQRRGTSKLFLFLLKAGVTGGAGSDSGGIFVRNVQHRPRVEGRIFFRPLAAGPGPVASFAPPDRDATGRRPCDRAGFPGRRTVADTAPSRRLRRACRRRTAR